MILLLFFLNLLLYFSSILTSEILDVTHVNFQSITKDKKCMFLFVERPDGGICLDCKLLYHKFVTTSQTFEGDNDIFFGRVSDRTLVDMFEVDSFPEIVYYELGSAIPTRYRGDVTASAVEELVTKVMRGNFDNLKRHYSVELTMKNFEEILNNPDQYRLVMLHENEDEDDIAAYEELAKTYDNEKELVIARIDIDKQRPLSRKFGSMEYPCFYWYSKGKDTKRKRYGGEMDLKQMIQFVNKQTGLQRLSGGSLGHRAGLIKRMDEIISTNINDIYKIKNLDGIILKMKKTVSKLEKSDEELAEYYIHCVEEINEDRTVDSLGDEKNRLFRRMNDDNLGPVRKDMFWKKVNIVNKFIDLIGRHIIGDMGMGNEDIMQSFDLGNEDEKEFDPNTNKNPIIFREEL